MSDGSPTKSTANELHASAEPSASMRAIRQEEWGGPDVLREVVVPRPVPGIGQILVKVSAAGVNPTDWKHRSAERFLGRPPFILGWDVSGVVEAVGIGVTLLKPGDQVFGMLPYPRCAGAYAEFVVGPARAFVHRPVGLGNIEAAALPLAALTAWQALVDTARIDAGDRVLVHAGAGGVGHLAVQIAKAHGAYVISTASKAKHDFVRSLGADEVIDYRRVDFSKVVSGMDVVLDAVGGDYQLRSLLTLRPGGLMVSTSPFAAEGLSEKARDLQVRTELIVVEPDHAGLSAIANLVSEGHLAVTIAETFPLAQAAKAHEAGERGGLTGKLVLLVDGSDGR